MNKNAADSNLFANDDDDVNFSDNEIDSDNNVKTAKLTKSDPFDAVKPPSNAKKAITLSTVNKSSLTAVDIGGIGGIGGIGNMVSKRSRKPKSKDEDGETSIHSVPKPPPSFSSSNFGLLKPTPNFVNVVNPASTARSDVSKIQVASDNYQMNSEMVKSIVATNTKMMETIAKLTMIIADNFVSKADFEAYKHSTREDRVPKEKVVIVDSVNDAITIFEEKLRQFGGRVIVDFNGKQEDDPEDLVVVSSFKELFEIE